MHNNYTTDENKNQEVEILRKDLFERTARDEDKIDELIVLRDVNEKTGKEIDWQDKKIKNDCLADSYKRLGNFNKYLRTSHCGDFLEFRLYENGEKRLHNANFCKVRLCPMCSWRRTLKIYAQTLKIMEAYSSQYPTHRYLFLTLTVKNVNAVELSNAITEILEGFKRLMEYKRVSSVVKGYMRGLEVTYNPDTQTFHPHIHSIIAVPSNYFKKTYIKQADWTELWKKAIKADYKPIIDIRPIRPKEIIKDINADISDIECKYSGAVAEVAKYAVKSSDYLIKNNEPLTDNLVYILDSALANRRLFTYGKKFRELHKKLNLDDADDGDFIFTGLEEASPDELQYILIRYGWSRELKKYLLMSILRDEESGNYDFRI